MANQNNYQNKYWSQLRQLRTHVIYLHFYALHSEWRDKTVGIFLAVTSSTSIGLWVVWKEHAMVWAAIIAGSQVVTAVRPFLPYKQRVTVIAEFTDAIQSIALESEKHWYQVAEGIWTEQEIHDKYIELATKVQKAEQKCLRSVLLPLKRKLLALAEVEADKYLRAHYFGG